MELKRYHDIPHIAPKYSTGFMAGDIVWIEEKIDGANIAIRYDSDTDTIVGQSRRRFVDEINDLRGFYNFVRNLNDNTTFKDRFKRICGNYTVLFGEWLVPHSVPYPEDRYGKAYFYDMFSLQHGMYAHQDIVRDVVRVLELTFVPVFYVGTFKSWEFVNTFVGKTKLGGEYGEGVVCKNQTRLNDPHIEYYIKVVCDQFKETKGHKQSKKVDMDKIAAREAAVELTKTIVTCPRITKILHKLVDEGVIPQDWGSESMQTIAKNLPKLVVQDCYKEERETVNQVPDFGKIANSITMAIARDILRAREQ